MRQAATLIEPAWTTASHTSRAEIGLTAAALVLYADADPVDLEATPETLLHALHPHTLAHLWAAPEPPTGPAPQDALRATLRSFGHDLADGSELSTLITRYTHFSPPPSLTAPAHVPSDEDRVEGTLLGAGGRWVTSLAVPIQAGGGGIHRGQ